MLSNSETLRLLDAVRVAHGGCTDYRVSRLLNVTSNRTSYWRKGGHMSDEYAYRCAELAGLDPVESVLRVAGERESGRTAEVARLVLARLSHAASILLAILLGVGLVGMPREASAAEVSRPFARSTASQTATPVIYYVKLIIRGWLARLARLFVPLTVLA